MYREKSNIILVGGGGHCKSCIEIIETTQLYNIIGILDLPSENGKTVLGYKVIGNDDDYLMYKEKDCSFFITTGQIKSSHLRKRIFEKLKQINAKIETIISPKAIVSKYASIGEGAIIMNNCIVNADAQIGENCIINNGAIIEHDVKIGKHTHISTNATVNGNVIIGDCCFVGSNTCISNGITLGNNIVIGAGSTVIKNIIDKGIYVGSPAKKKLI